MTLNKVILTLELNREPLSGKYQMNGFVLLVALLNPCLQKKVADIKSMEFDKNIR
jgi:hypothetical protein